MTKRRKAREFLLVMNVPKYSIYESIAQAYEIKDGIIYHLNLEGPMPTYMKEIKVREVLPTKIKTKGKIK